MKRKLLLLASLCVAPLARGEQTQYIVHRGTDFQNAQIKDLSINNYGDLQLGRMLIEKLPSMADVGGVFAIAEGADGAIFAGTGPGGKVIRIAGENHETIAEFGESDTVTSLLLTADGTLLAGVTGGAGQVAVVDPSGKEKPRIVLEQAEVAFVWAMLQMPDSKVYVATGPSGQVWEIDLAKQSSRKIFDSEESNCLSLATDNKGSLFVGTDPSGLVWKIDLATGKTFVLLDAAETEIGSLLYDEKTQTLLAATSQQIEESDQSSDAASAPSGRPGVTERFELPQNLPAMPAPPQPVGAMNEPQPLQTAPADEPAPGVDAVPQSGSAIATDTATNGNAVYAITADGVSSELWRGNQVVYAMASQGDQTMLAMGSPAAVLSLDRQQESFATLASPAVTAVTSLKRLANGQLALGTSGAASVLLLDASMAMEGSLESDVIDTQQVSRFGVVDFDASVPQGSGVTISTRSGNIGGETFVGWSAWSAPAPATRFTAIETPAARFVQYRLNFTGNGAASPTLSGLKLAYQMPNVAPRIEAVSIIADAATPSARSVEWSASDGNGDAMQFTLSIRQGNAPWSKLAVPTAEATFALDTNTLSDGRYQIRVEASDAKSNDVGVGKSSSRVSEWFLIDNTPPSIGDFKITPDGDSITVALRVADRLSAISSLEYSLDAASDWQSVSPSDKLSDSPDERYVVSIAGVKSPRVLALRAKDAAGNVKYESITLGK